MLCFPIISYFDVLPLPVHVCTYVFVNFSSKCFLLLWFRPVAAAASFSGQLVPVFSTGHAVALFVYILSSISKSDYVLSVLTYSLFPAIRSPSADMYCWLVLCRRDKQTAAQRHPIPAHEIKLYGPRPHPPFSNRVVFVSGHSSYCCVCLFVCLFVLDVLVDAFTCWHYVAGNCWHYLATNCWHVASICWHVASNCWHYVTSNF